MTVAHSVVIGTDFTDRKMIRIISLIIAFLICSCTSDKVQENEIKDFFTIYKNLINSLNLQRSLKKAF